MSAGQRPASKGPDPRLEPLRKEIALVCRMSADVRWKHFFHLGNHDDEVSRTRVADCKWVFNSWVGTASDFRYCLSKVPSWALAELRKRILKPLVGGPMSMTKLRAIDARMRREAKAQKANGADTTAKPAIGRAGL